jgi:hypothetical protein
MALAGAARTTRRGRIRRIQIWKRVKVRLTISNSESVSINFLSIGTAFTRKKFQGLNLS